MEAYDAGIVHQAPPGAGVSDVMTLGKIFGILIFSSLAATGATLAGGISKNLANSRNLANAKQVANVKGDKVPPKQVAASVSVHHKTKLHHVKIKPLDSNGNSISADGSQYVQLKMK
jgi:hypothetical protein